MQSKSQDENYYRTTKSSTYPFCT